MSDIDSVKVVVVGDSGVGKSSLVHRICNSVGGGSGGGSGGGGGGGDERLSSLSWTIGCSADVYIHEYRDGLPDQRTVAVDLWDVGGSSGHRRARRLFYAHAHGVVLVYDLSNRKTLLNLSGWLSEVLNAQIAPSGGGGGGGSSGLNTANSQTETDLFSDFETMRGQHTQGRWLHHHHHHQQQQQQLPLLMVGCKLDLAGSEQRASVIRRAGQLSEQLGAEQLLLDCHDRRCLAPASSNAVRLSHFFDQVIERRWNVREPSSSSAAAAAAASSPLSAAVSPTVSAYARSMAAGVTAARYASAIVSPSTVSGLSGVSYDSLAPTATGSGLLANIYH